jgi:hypothetical protein
MRQFLAHRLGAQVHIMLDLLPLQGDHIAQGGGLVDDDPQQRQTDQNGYNAEYPFHLIYNGLR